MYKIGASLISAEWERRSLEHPFIQYEEHELSAIHFAKWKVGAPLFSSEGERHSLEPHSFYRKKDERYSFLPAEKYKHTQHLK